jgi:putative endonuclease
MGRLATVRMASPHAKQHMKDYYVYILTNRSYTTLSIGVTSNLEARVWQHKTKAARGFTSRYRTELLVYYESTTDVYAALEREKQLKGWSRAKKNALVESMNPSWYDLSEARFPTATPDPSLRSG